MPRLLFSWVCLVFASLILLAIIASAQDASTGAIRGTVVDPSGRPIVEASIVLVDSAQGFRYFVTSDSAGQFVFELLPPGEYSARAVAPDMSPQLTPKLHVDVGATTEVEFKLQVGGAKEMVTVAGEPPMVETQSSAVSSLVDNRAIEELPLDGRRFTDLALLTPGVNQDPRGLTSGSNGDLAFGGIRGYQSSYLVDGADNNNAFFAQARGRYRAPYQFSNASPRIPTARNWGEPAARSSTWLRNQGPINSTEAVSISFATAPLERLSPSSISSPTHSSSNSASPWADPSTATACFSLAESISTSFTFRP
jgi:hypothetical protein